MLRTALRVLPRPMWRTVRARMRRRETTPAPGDPPPPRSDGAAATVGEQGHGARPDPSQPGRSVMSVSAPHSLYGLDPGIPLHGQRVLILDDNTFNRRTLTRFLTWAGIRRVDAVTEPDEIMAALEAVNPDMVVIDSDMVGLDGIALCRRLRDDRRWRDLPVVMQTGLPSDQFRAVCFQAGATDIIGKPVNPGECIARVRYHLERRQLIHELRGFRERVERDLMQARDMQLALVPETAHVAAVGERHDMWIDAAFRSSDEIGGDFWSLFELDAQRLAVFVADFSGHGIAAAINAFRLHTLLTRLPQTEMDDPAALLALLNQRLKEILPVGQFATAFYGIIDRAEGLLTYAAAGAPNPILGGGGTFRPLDASGFLLGAFYEATFENHVVPFCQGESLFLYSDGLSEAQDGCGSMMGEDGLLDLVAAAAHDNHARPLPGLLDAVAERYGERLHDDLTAVWITRR